MIAVIARDLVRYAAILRSYLAPSAREKAAFGNASDHGDHQITAITAI